MAPTPLLRVVGVGVAVLQQVNMDILKQEKQTTLRSGWFQALPGNQHTTPRGELYAFLFCLRTCSGDIHYNADYMGVVTGFNRGRHLSPQQRHRGLWDQILGKSCNIEEKQGIKPW